MGSTGLAEIVTFKYKIFVQILFLVLAFHVAVLWFCQQSIKEKNTMILSCSNGAESIVYVQRSDFWISGHFQDSPGRQLKMENIRTAVLSRNFEVSIDI